MSGKKFTPKISMQDNIGRFTILGLISALEVHLVRTCSMNSYLKAFSKSDREKNEYQLNVIKTFKHLQYFFFQKLHISPLF